MKIVSVILVFILICSGFAYDWGGSDYEEDSLEMGDAGVVAKVPGMCWACKWLLNKVKKSISADSTKDEIQGKLRAGCEQIGFLRSMCKGFVKKYVSVLVEELSTTDDVRTICVSLKACKPKELIYL
ncbi:hypothetical protein ACEWY4_005284 [Coilia grayii]|uniref:Saposin B-type domain-containing protein n=1 Tax=Coilia grayii TaxID=363190 RepID=A0ABD1KHV8_9TELE